MDIRHRVGQRIRDLRNERGWTLEKLAERSGKHWTYLGGIERGIRNPTVCVLEVIAKALDVPISDFFAETKHRRHL
jgi:transcriptional regulator with XRE-family HTH domain